MDQILISNLFIIHGGCDAKENLSVSHAANWALMFRRLTQELWTSGRRRFSGSGREETQWGVLARVVSRTGVRRAGNGAGLSCHGEFRRGKKWQRSDVVVN